MSEYFSENQESARVVLSEVRGLHRLKVDNGIFLDGNRLYGVREYSVVQKEEDDQATLTIKMDVTILGHS